MPAATVERPPQVLTCRERKSFQVLDQARRIHQVLSCYMGCPVPWEKLDNRTHDAYIAVAVNIREEAFPCPSE